MANKGQRYELVQDRKGMLWDLLLYVPTVIALAMIGLKLWFSADKNWSYILIFLATLFSLIGANRILKTRLMLLPGAAVALGIDKDRITMDLRDGSQQVLIKDLKMFSEIGGKTFALTGMDLTGKKQQYIFHAGQFQDVGEFNSAKALLDIYR